MRIIVSPPPPAHPGPGADATDPASLYALGCPVWQRSRLRRGESLYHRHVPEHPGPARARALPA